MEPHLAVAPVAIALADQGSVPHGLRIWRPRAACRVLRPQRGVVVGRLALALALDSPDSFDSLLHIAIEVRIGFRLLDA